MLGWVTPLGTDTHPTVFQMPPQLETGRHQTSEHHYHLGTTKRPPLAEGAGVDVRGFCFHILGEPGQSREPHFPSEQQVVGKLPGVHLSRGPEGDPGTRHGTELEVPRIGSENRLQTGSNTGLLDKQLSWAEHSSRGGGRSGSWGCLPSLLRPRSEGQKSEEAGSGAVGGGGVLQTPGRG